MFEIAHSYVMVYNPTAKDYWVKWAEAGVHYYAGKGDSVIPEGDPPDRRWVIPNINTDKGFGKGKLEVPYYIGQKYVREMIAKLVSEEADKQAFKLRKSFKRDPSEWGTWWEMNWRSYVDKDAMEERYIKILMLGVTREYTKDIPDIIPQKPVQPNEIETFENMPKYTVAEQSIIEDNKKAFAKQVAA